MTPEELEARRHVLGASEIGTAAGYDIYNNPRTLWVAKMFPIAYDFESEDAACGKMVEPGLIAWAKEELGLRSVTRAKRQLKCRRRDFPFITATLDGWAPHERAVLEAKLTADLYQDDPRHQWGEPGTDQVPWKVNCQVQQQMGAKDAVIAHVVAFLIERNRKYRAIYHIPRDDDLIDHLVGVGRDFWGYVERGEMPPGDEPASPRILNRIEREPEVVAELDADLFVQWQEAKRLRKKYDDEAKDLGTRLKEQLWIPGETPVAAELGRCEAGEVTFFANKKGVRSMRERAV